MIAELAAGRDLTRRSDTVRELVESWLEAMRRHIRPSTYKHYSVQVGHIARHIGTVKVSSLSVEHVQRLADGLADDGLGPAAVKMILSRLHAACERVVPELLAASPVRWKKLKLRKVEDAERVPLDAEQLRRLLLAADDLDERGDDARYAPCYWLLGLLGLRIGEALGLSWRDVDFNRATITIRQQRAAHSEKLLSDTKTTESRRTLPMGPRLTERLRAHWQQLQTERRHLGTAWKEHGLVIVRGDGTPPGLDLARRHLAALSRRQGLPHVHPHLLRHTVASLLDELGHTETVVAALLGHSRGGSTTGKYTHARTERLRRAVTELETAVFSTQAERQEAAR
jgi:integrase